MNSSAQWCFNTYSSPGSGTAIAMIDRSTSEIGSRKVTTQSESVFVTTTAVNTPSHPWRTHDYERMVRAGHAYRGIDFRLADDPKDADFILFVGAMEHYLGDICRSPLFRRHHDRCYVYNSSDGGIPFLPGMYPGVAGPVRLPDLQFGAFFLRPFDNKELAPRYNEAKRPTRLFSFVGTVKYAPEVRGRVLALQHPDALLLNRSKGVSDEDYIEKLRDSYFVLCPRSLSPDTWRIYETMMAARVPVIIADGWVPPRDIDWPSCSFRVSENNVESIPRLCAANVTRAREMGLRARQEWETHCSLEGAFGWVGRRLRELREARKGRTLHPAFDLIRDLAFRRQLLQYGRWRVGKTLREHGLRR
jgi:hypothetical protein